MRARGPIVVLESVNSGGTTPAEILSQEAERDVPLTGIFEGCWCPCLNSAINVDWAVGNVLPVGSAKVNAPAHDDRTFCAALCQFCALEFLPTLCH